ncbi:MAG TPA: spermidine synthase [Nitrospirae bacterium]|nr:spermidine synthase [bacterium BMS3Abin10]GBE40070.1 spermidine synthase [bacterium BMS3Bbin08]HDH00934.1 spermidine synthase [Nitrospirota bacterium]HDH34282.1 spermidine synthase [Nitrospirota bacterium]HDH49859.1 spermidine synthase [Nitrospirota bacterium]
MAKPWITIGRENTADGLLELRQRNGSDFLMTIDGRVLMNSHANRSEVLLAKLACNSMNNKKDPKVLIGGLGMGCTLKSALDELPGNARVVVAELNPIVVKWCRGPMTALTCGAVNDPRVTIEIANVASLIRNGAMEGGDNRFDAIIIDLYEGPFEAAKERGDYLYGNTALKMSGSALRPGGVFAVWSEDPDRSFERRLVHAGFSFKRHRPGRGNRHVVYIAKKSGSSPSRRPRRSKVF